MKTSKYKKQVEELVKCGVNPLQYYDIARELDVSLSDGATILMSMWWEIEQWEKEYNNRKISGGIDGI